MIPAHLRVDPTEALANKCPACEEWLLEAWERMRFAGIRVNSGPGVYRAIGYLARTDKEPHAAR